MVDNGEIVVRGGNGGHGAVTFHREKFAPRGGPDGGDGGKGGSVIIQADCNVDDLSQFKSRRLFQAQAGQPGGRNKKSGRNAPDLVVTAPVGTIVRDVGEPAEGQPGGVVLADLARHGDSVVVAEGGRGGWGNMHFATPSRQAPTEAKPGTPGQERRLELEMRLASDAALVGPPNSGKSALLAAISRAPVVVAEYPFTTREPVLGTADLGKRNAVLVELPGIVAGAAEGRGLGNRFLRHALRAGALIYVLAADSADPVADYVAVRDEMYRYDSALKAKPQLVAVNKADLPEARQRAAALRREFHKVGVTPIFVSATGRKGVKELVEKAVEDGEKAGQTVAAATEECPVTVFRPKPKARKAGGKGDA